MESAETQVPIIKRIIHLGSKENHFNASKYLEMIEDQKKGFKDIEFFINTY